MKQSWPFGPRSISLCAVLVVGSFIALAGEVHAQFFAYVTNLNSDARGSLAVIDTATRSVVATIPVGLGPYDLAASPDGGRVYVLNSNSKAIDVIDTLTRTIVDRVKLPDPDRLSPTSFAVSPDGAFAYLAINDDGFLLPGQVLVIDLASEHVVVRIFFDRAGHVALSPDAATLFVDGSPGLGRIDTSDNTLIDTIPLFTAGQLAVSADGGSAYSAPCLVAGDDYTATRMCIVDTRTGSASSVPIFAQGSAAVAIAASPRDDFVYISHVDMTTGNGALAVFDVASQQVMADVPVGNSPNRVAATPDGAEVYVTNLGSDTVSVIDTVTDTVARTIPVGPWPAAIVIAPAPPNPPLPTATRHPTRTPTPTAARTTASLDVSSASGMQGDEVSIAVTLDTAGEAIAAVQNDISFAADATPLLRCAFNPALDKNFSGFAFSHSGMRAIVAGIDTTPIPDGALLYTCTVRISSAAAPGARYSLFNSHVIASDPEGNTVVVNAASGTIFVLLPPTATRTPTPTPTSTPTPPPMPTCAPANAGARVLAYVANYESNDVSVIDTTCSAVVATIPLPAGIAPLGVALASDGSAAYVSVLTPGAPPQLVVIDPATQSVAAAITIDEVADTTGSVTHDLAVAPDGRFVYVIAEASQRLMIIDAATHAVVHRIPLGHPLRHLAVSPDGRTAFVTQYGRYCLGDFGCVGGIDVVDVDRSSDSFGAVLQTLAFKEFDPFGIAVAPTGTVYTTDAGYPNSAVSAIDRRSGAFTLIGVGSSPTAIALSPDARFAYVTNVGTEALSVIDTTASATVAIVTLDSPLGVAVAPDGHSVYVTNRYPGTVSVIDAATNTVTASIPVGFAPRAIAVGVVPTSPDAAATPAAAAIDSNPNAARAGGDGAGAGGCSIAPGRLRQHGAAWLIVGLLLWAGRSHCSRSRDRRQSWMTFITLSPHRSHHTARAFRRTGRRPHGMGS